MKGFCGLVGISLVSGLAMQRDLIDMTLSDDEFQYKPVPSVPSFHNTVIEEPDDDDYLSMFEVERTLSDDEFQYKPVTSVPSFHNTVIEEPDDNFYLNMFEGQRKSLRTWVENENENEDDIDEDEDDDAFAPVIADDHEILENNRQEVKFWNHDNVAEEEVGDAFAPVIADDHEILENNRQAGNHNNVAEEEEEVGDKSVFDHTSSLLKRRANEVELVPTEEEHFPKTLRHWWNRHTTTTDGDVENQPALTSTANENQTDLTTESKRIWWNPMTWTNHQESLMNETELTSITPLQKRAVPTEISIPSPVTSTAPVLSITPSKTEEPVTPVFYKPWTWGWKWHDSEVKESTKEDVVTI
jgi:hypothetical protein